MSCLKKRNATLTKNAMNSIDLIITMSSAREILKILVKRSMMLKLRSVSAKPNLESMKKETRISIDKIMVFPTIKIESPERKRMLSMKNSSQKPVLMLLLEKLNISESKLTMKKLIFLL